MGVIPRAPIVWSHWERASHLNAWHPRIALRRRETRQDNADESANAVTAALYAHGNWGATITDALADDRLCASLSPLAKDDALADALRNVPHTDPDIRQRMAYALHAQGLRAAIRIC